MAGACAFSHQNVSNQTFPTNFLIGAATSAFQIEGAWNESGIFLVFIIHIHFFGLINRLGSHNIKFQKRTLLPSSGIWNIRLK
jgi:hypothetical protein